jgi:uncharacterized protein YjiS (DUF1127 family)
MTAIHGASELGVTRLSTRHVSNIVKRCLCALQERRRRAELRAILYGLGDRELKDIGLACCEIEYLVLKGTREHIDPRSQRMRWRCFGRSRG